MVANRFTSRQKNLLKSASSHDHQCGQLSQSDFGCGILPEERTFPDVTPQRGTLRRTARKFRRLKDVVISPVYPAPAPRVAAALHHRKHISP